MKYQILTGDNRQTLKTIPDNSIDAIVTDPPYGIDFLGKSWDANTGALETYQECLRVLKPGGHILAFSAARTYHHLAITLEQAGFEIRDQIMWIYSSGFPKSQDIGKSIQRSLGVKETKKVKQGIVTGGELTRGGLKTGGGTGGGTGGTHESVICTDPQAQQWSGWGTALKPAHEPIALARKPIKLSIAKNCQEHGVGALNIDATRIDWEPGEQEKEQAWREKYTKTNTGGPIFAEQKKNDLKAGGQTVDAPAGRFPSNVIGEIPDYQKYFYCPKVSRAERHIESAVENNHPTVKPIELMKYLIRLITPPGGTVLDPFNGSGSTGCAAVELGHPYIGCELDPAYVEIACKRIEAWYAQANPTTFGTLFTQE